MMHSSLMRLNATVSYGLTVLAIMTTVCIVSTYFMFNKEPTVTFNVWDPQLQRVRSYHSDTPLDRGLFTFRLTTDLSPLYHWNTKLLFVYVVAEYETEEMNVNQIVLWDQIILKEETDRHGIDERRIQLKYPFLDEGHGLLGNNVTLALHWNHVPVVGPLTRHSTGHTTFEMPDYYNTW
eukprot:m.16984 g.16984  ORF g.16984 m.16984 type:complete len:179 (-) comp4702_c0_seq2:111-647(-)